MANLDFYKRNFNTDTFSELEQIFYTNFVETNLTYTFFVDWLKINRNRDYYRNELALLSSLKGISNPKEQLFKLVSKYPEVVRVMPLLLAEREKVLKVLHDFKPEYRYIIYDFSKDTYSYTEITKIVEFCERTGLLAALSHMESPIDYMTGVEVGLDSNARKNRSGNFMEDAVDDILDEFIALHPEIKCISQKQFKYIKNTYHISVSDGLLDRKFDDVLIKGETGINIEVNFYGGTGSKPSEIVESYISRRQELDSMGWKFVWITDGPGWLKMKNQFRRGLENFDYVFNLSMLRQGLLEKVIINED